MIYQPLITKSESYVARLCSLTTFPPHWHDDIEILAPLRGDLHVRIDGSDYTLTPSDFVIIMPGCVHEITACADRQLVVIAEFGYSLLGNGFRILQNSCLASPFFSMECAPDVLAGAVSNLAELLRSEEQRGPANNWRIQSLLLQIAAYLPEITVQREIPHSKQFKALYPILAYLQAHFTEPITVKEAAAIVGYQEIYFCRQFQKIIGVPFHKYLNYYRVEVSRHYLSESMLPVREIAEAVGFTSSKQYCRVFKSLMDMTPTQYRRLDVKEQQPAKI